MKKLKFPVAALATSIFLTACGGGGNAGGNPATGIIDLGDNPPVDNPPPADNTVSLDGIAADGYLVGATVCLDLNSNLSCDTGEPSATTGAGGVFSIDATQAQIDANSLVLIASPSTTTDEDTGSAVAGDFVLTAPVGATFVSPITTLVQARIEDGETLAAASSAVEGQLGITDFAADYIANNDEATHRVAQALTQIQIDAVSEFNAAGDGSTLGNILDATVEVVESVVTAAADSSASIADIANANTVSEIVTIGDLDGETISGDILSDMTLTADRTWILDGVVTVGAGNVTVNNDADVSGIRDAGVTLTIEAGTDVRATSDAVLIVTRGSKIMAEGTAAAPITFSSVDEGYDGLGEWGGVVVQGFAPQYGAGGTGACFGSGTVCNVEGEGGTSVAVYGGNDPADDSGVMRYVRIAEGGLVAGPNNEVNGLTLQGVGHATTLEFIQVHNNLDDGIEWFGGTVNLKYAVLTNNDDDSLDYDEGYQGNIQHAIIRMSQTATAPQGSNDPRGIEANSSDEDFVEETNATVANVLLVGGQINDGEPGMRLRGALTTAVYNSAVTGFSRSCVRIDNAEVAGTTINSNVTLMNMMGDCEGGFFHNDNRPVNDFTPIESSITLNSALAITETEAALSSSVTPTAVDNGSGFVFDSTDYIGAVDPDVAQADAWWNGWIISGSLGEEVAAPGTGGGAISCSDATNCTISGTVTEDVTLDADINWTLDGVVRVGRGNVTVANDADVQAIKDAGVTLTVEAGADIKATGDGTLLVTRGSKLMAVGTASQPITFSSEDDGYDGLGEWGGVVIQGFAPQYGAGGTGACFGSGTVCNVEGEGGTSVAVYGGNDPADDSGMLRYVRIAEGGLVAGPNNEVNGLTLQGVGHATTLEFIQVHNNLDDGIEWFGGTVNAKWVVLTNNDDDSLDYDEGYQGNIQFAIIRMSQEATAPQGSNDPRGIEANSSDEDFVQETNATVANALLIGGQINDGEPGMRLRGALTTGIYNSAVRGFTRSCVRIDNAEVAGSTIDSNVTLMNMIGDCDGGFFHNDNRPLNDFTPIELNFTLTGALAIADVEAQLSSNVTPAAVDNGSGFVFESTDYIGAVEPGTSQANAWWSGWTIEGSLGEDQVSQTFPDFVDCSADGCTQTATVSGTIAEDYTFTSDLQWILDGVVRVGQGNVTVSSDADVNAIKSAGVTLTIEAGTDVRAQGDGTLLVTRGSKLDAVGTRTAPITFSSEDDGYDGLGEWGGVVIQGFAPQYGAGGTGACFGSGTTCNVEGEGGTSVAVYGGNDEADDSGTLRYVRIAEGGLVAGPNNEVNGLTLQGVGYGTTLEFIQVHNNLDDGVEWFGGTVNAKWLVLTNNDDDSIDYDEGYVGNIQYAIIKMQQAAGTAPQGSNDPRGIEANSSDEDFVQETNAVLANISLMGGDINAGEPGMRLRGALTTSVYNTAVEGFDRSCVRVDDANVAGSVIESDVTLVNVLGDCMTGYYHNDRIADTEINSGANVVTYDDAFAMNEIQAVLSSAPSINPVGNSSFTFDQTAYVGAVEPGTAAADAWWADWTIPGSLEKETNAVDASPSFVSCTGNACEITGDITEDYTLVAGVDWSMDGVVTVGTGNTTVNSDADVQAIKDAGATLTIEAGVEVTMSSDGTLIVTRGSKIIALGEADEPITFSSADAGYDGLGEWGGVVIQGFAPQYGAGGTGACFGNGTTCNVEGEGGTAVAVYGGNDPADDSGMMRYVRIAEGGLIAGPNNELNGLTLQGVGHATDLQYIQVHNNLDDGIEWFGGTANLKYAVLTNNDDDSLDFDEGYQGNIQHAIIRMSQTASAPQGSNDPRGVEANSSDEDFVQETNGAMANLLLIGATINDGEPGMRLRGALTTSVYNTAITGFDRSCVRIDDASVAGSTIVSNVTLVNVIGSCTQGFYHGTSGEPADTETNAGAGTVTVDAAYALTDSAAELGSAPTMTAVDNGSGFTFDSTDYIGAVEPGSDAAATWWSDWVIEGSLD